MKLEDATKSLQQKGPCRTIEEETIEKLADQIVSLKEELKDKDEAIHKLVQWQATAKKVLKYIHNNFDTIFDEWAPNHNSINVNIESIIEENPGWKVYWDDLDEGGGSCFVVEGEDGRVLGLGSSIPQAFEDADRFVEKLELRKRIDSTKKQSSETENLANKLWNDAWAHEPDTQKETLDEILESEIPDESSNDLINKTDTMIKALQPFLEILKER